MQKRRQWNDIVKVQKENNCPARVPLHENTRHKGDNTLSHKHKLRFKECSRNVWQENMIPVRNADLHEDMETDNDKEEGT